ncbi:bifunctional diaminohydroxyphosphoribosylaminopyrimidine deaminase/5-amino-6-(5-phosphoribosylamino)uracil reductase RibD [Geoalkalibacter halelectricus]|uniref:Riboflavin biosynthesis protein RibD n=1 Tax=Geoalkalibacter halelectricus TaxID=2847045 RepID=A0ABY5ZR77_9BACT|nr:bifunctional diaminohydroxyphosphoribosylaminopyrimidine deaminase/5-amino-6-(5-phosphoribosylamino)uracil reductase RibD [Geoalkalibacter halelectricus]MDO3380022.1 bifunctional diaminohydroxyphosphoribosylaminopyrimidine deaminase/5-amino-6-(5-phosphoribosylamino)uracil reductase RibD [Geoalkalibacter halelectricus]UWZ80452.1 bifunctional diaminohydroxyphosphoribosylaminopyrimidine deaminase/5-amino-6-(5-phosphoribosylamino)uracil reductase RibD [Geoalkalibacter halelectricus]
MTQAEHYMQRALDLAAQGEGRTRPNPPVGALVVLQGRVIGEGFHQRAGEAHAEIIALRQAGENSRGADLYVTLEPCSHQGRTGPCADAVIAAGIRRVFIGCRDPNPQVAGRGVARLVDAGIEVVEGILDAQCRWLIGPFSRHITTGQPLVTLKAAISLDGRTATAQGDSQWISNPESRGHVHEIRDRVDAIMVGIGTALRDDPSLTTRLARGGRDAVRVVVDSRLRLPEDAKLLHLDSDAPTVIATTEQASYGKIRKLRDLGARVLVLPAKQERVDLGALLTALGGMDLQHLLLEGGADLNGAFLRERLIDRVLVYIAPRLIGGDGKALFDGVGAPTLSKAASLANLRLRRFGDDLCYEGEVRYVHGPD